MKKQIRETLGFFWKKTSNYKIGDRVFYEHALYSQKKINHQGHLGVWVISDVTDFGYSVNLEHGIVSMYCLSDFDLISTPDDVKNIPYPVGNVHIIL